MDKLLAIMSGFEQEPGASAFYSVLRGYPHLKNHVIKYLNARHKLMAEILLILNQSAPDK